MRLPEEDTKWEKIIIMPFLLGIAFGAGCYIAKVVINSPLMYGIVNATAEGIKNNVKIGKWRPVIFNIIAKMDQYLFWQFRLDYFDLYNPLKRRRKVGIKDLKVRRMFWILSKFRCFSIFIDDENYLK